MERIHVVADRTEGFAAKEVADGRRRRGVWAGRACIEGHEPEIHWSFSQLKIDLSSISDSLRGVENLKGDKIAFLVIVENNTRFILVAFVNGYVVL